MSEEMQSLRRQLKKAGRMGGLRGRSPAMQELYSLIERVAPTEASVFITGESGTGKTLIAKTVHDFSKRRSKPFVAVNCAAIAPTLIESELFGHEKGAFTGATQQRRGYFEEAFGGTIFLDEITELPIELQGKLLRVLEENRIRRVGGNQEVEINVRIVSASNRDPKKAIEDGKLREDLYYRINIFPIHACALRERRPDIPFLSQMFLDFGLRNACDAFDRRQRQRIQLIARAHDQRLRDGQRKRQTNRELHALADLGCGEQRAAEFLDLVDHHVHADAAARMLSDAARSAEARLENQMHGFFVGQHAARL